MRSKRRESVRSFPPRNGAHFTVPMVAKQVGKRRLISLCKQSAWRDDWQSQHLCLFYLNFKTFTDVNILC